MAKKSSRTLEKKENAHKWPKRHNLVEAVNVFERFKNLCTLQLEQGYWATIDFPSKHHINKILSIQYMDKKALEDEYGTTLVDRVFDLIPYCKSYVVFTRKKNDLEEGK